LVGELVAGELLAGELLVEELLIGVLLVVAAFDCVKRAVADEDCAPSTAEVGRALMAELIFGT
jgi:hypothetical protein